MSVWITGARGFIGGHLARQLADAGHAVHGIGHGAIDDAGRSRLGLRSWIDGEIEAANLDALAAAHGLPVAVVHMAGGSSVGLAVARPFEDFARTVLSTARLLEWVRVHAPQSRIIAASSAAVYGAGHSGPIAEQAALNPVSPYGQHKLMMEQLCRSYCTTYGIHSTVLRLFSVYGPGLHKQLLWDACSRLQDNPRELVLGGTGEEVRDWCDVRDVVRLVATLADSARDGGFHVVNAGSGRGMRVAEIAGLLASHWGNARVRFTGDVRVGDPFSLLADTTQLRQSGFQWRIDPAQGIADYVGWFRDQARG